MAGDGETRLRTGSTTGKIGIASSVKTELAPPILISTVLFPSMAPLPERITSTLSRKYRTIPGRTRASCGKSTTREWRFVLKKALPRVWNPNDSTFRARRPACQARDRVKQRPRATRRWGISFRSRSLQFAHPLLCCAWGASPGLPFTPKRYPVCSRPFEIGSCGIRRFARGAWAS